MNLDTLHKEVEDLFPKMVEIRRYLHQHPELSYQEVETPKFIANYLTDLGIEVRRNVGGSGRRWSSSWCQKRENDSPKSRFRCITHSRRKRCTL